MFLSLMQKEGNKIDVIENNNKVLEDQPLILINLKR